MSTPACQSYIDDSRDDSLRQSWAGGYIVVKNKLVGIAPMAEFGAR